MKSVRAIVVFIFLAAFSAFAADIDPVALVKSNVDEVLTVIKQSKDKRALQDLAEQKIATHFDFQAMTRFAVGRSWRDATPEQQRRLENAFRGLLVRTYTTSLSQSNLADVTVDVKPAQVKPGQDEVLVKSVAKQSECAGARMRGPNSRPQRRAWAQSRADTDKSLANSINFIQYRSRP